MSGIKRSRQEYESISESQDERATKRACQRTIQRNIAKGDLDALTIKVFHLLGSIDKAREMLIKPEFDTEAVNDIVEEAAEAVSWEAASFCKSLKELDPNTERWQCVPGLSELSIRLVKH